MSRPVAPLAPGPAPQPIRDRGSSLPMVLVMMVILALIVLPTMTYATTVLRANTVLSQKSKRIEATKAGLRVALADPVELYKACSADNAGTTVGRVLAPPSLDINVTTKCYFVGSESAQSSDELRYGLVTTRQGQTPPAQLTGNPYPTPSPWTPSGWIAATTPTSVTDKIWLPNLPVQGLNLRAPTGTQMAPGFPTCRVYFPGTYVNPIVLNGPTYFTSGIYYFEDEVRVQGGASVTVGLGAIPGCTTDQEAIFYAENVPDTHNMSGLGATWVLGHNGRVVVSNDADLSLRFNKRYVASTDIGGLPSADVSIMSVNGAMAADGTTGIALALPDIEVPLGLVGSVSPAPATQQSYRPSRLTPAPTQPTAPTGVTAERFSGAAVVSWTAPASNGGSAITNYTATSSTGAICTTAGATSCAMPSLANGTSMTFTVVATNALGSSPASAPSAAITTGGAALVVPTTPARPTATPYSSAARVTWTAPANGGAPITSYTATASPGGLTCTLDMTVATPPPLSCDIAGLDPAIVPGYTFTVTATSAKGTSAASPASTPAIVPLATLGAPPPPVAPAAPPAYLPPSIVAFELTGTALADIQIPGYISVPQGRVDIVNPNSKPLQITGGILASQFTVNDARPAPIPVGFEVTQVQRKLRIVSTTDEGVETSTAIVQVNQNGAYAINSWEVQ